MGPAALDGYLWLDHGERCQKPLTAVGDDHLDSLFCKASSIGSVRKASQAPWDSPGAMESGLLQGQGLKPIDWAYF